MEVLLDTTTRQTMNDPINVLYVDDELDFAEMAAPFSDGRTTDWRSRR